ncbi:MAG TPA: class I SAM-dependent methyltransferase [Xanthobacteraceae bacterium]|nr:class I SAM-dependent methyltransferase [Xanthobacteraceae bacterium]
MEYRRLGFCPICEARAEFASDNVWYRDHLFCSGCGSIPRERALALALTRAFPNWRTCSIHESSPVARGISLKLSRECARYEATQFFPGEKLGSIVEGFRNENLEKQTFADEVFDIVISLDVMEHVNQPELCFKEIERTLKPGGAYIFTAPTYKEKTVSERRALYKDDGIEFLAEAEYHGSPVSDAGALVTFHYGYDLPEIIYQSSKLDVEVLRFNDHYHGIIGEFTETYFARKNPLAS